MRLTPDDIAARILYRDDAMLVLDKPAGIAVHKGPKGGVTLDDFLPDLAFGSPEVPQLAHRLDVTRRDTDTMGLGARIKTMRILEGQKLKPRRDIFGSGTASDPYRFRDGLLYHDAYYHYVRQEGIQVRSRRIEQLAGGFGDRVEVEDGRVLYFLNDKPTLE